MEPPPALKARKTNPPETCTGVEREPVSPVPLLEDDALRVELLVECEYFQTERVFMPEGGAFFGLADGATFEIFGVLEGTATIEWEGDPVTLSAVDWVLIPADLGEFQVISDGACTLLRVFVPE